MPHICLLFPRLPTRLGFGGGGAAQVWVQSFAKNVLLVVPHCLSNRYFPRQVRSALSVSVMRVPTKLVWSIRVLAWFYLLRDFLSPARQVLEQIHALFITPTPFSLFSP